MMAKPTFIQSRLQAGTWHVLLGDAGKSPPSISAFHAGRALPDLKCTSGDHPGEWRISLKVPQDALNDGMQTLVLQLADGTIIGSLPILAGAPLEDDLRSEIALLRDELDILKAAFRRSQC